MRALLLVLIIACAAPPAGARQQEDVREVDLSADSMVVRRVGNREIVELIGARLREGSTLLWADRLVDEGDGQLLFYRNVRVIDDGDTLTADRMRYNRYTKVGRATGDVRLADGEVIVTAPEGDYDTEAKRAEFSAGVRMQDSVSVLTSLRGTYWTDEKRAAFAGGVQLEGRDADLAADSILYFRDSERSEAFGDVVIAERDSAGSLVMIAADRVVDEPETGRANAYGRVFLAQIADTESDTLYVRAGRLVSIRTDSTELFQAADSVHVWGPEHVAVADSLAHQTSGGRSRSRLFGSPIGWFQDAQVSADTLEVAGRDAAIDTLRGWGQAAVMQRDSVLARFQQMKGGRLLGIFEDDSLRSLEVTPRAEALYHLTRDEDQPGGAVRTSADRIVFTFDETDGDGIRIYGGIEGTYYAEELLTEPMTLDGVAWRADRRPLRADPAARLHQMQCRIRNCTPD